MDDAKTVVEIELDGRPLTLTPTPEAIIGVSDAFDGLAPAMAAISRLSVKAMTVVINAGAGLKGDDAKGTAKAVASSNLVDLSGKLTDFVASLCNGGRPFKAG
ncbi:hypothetical protein MPLA_140348 [Mesorhizobium sp. ORS 3359]|nr:hypothetical protein MPLA_140348 [Mesorhizobium sp. ORS 3359]